MSDLKDQLGRGVYTLAEAARLIHGDARAIKRWLYGYDLKVEKDGSTVKRRAGPLWRTQYQGDDFQEKVIGFQDLLELRVVREFMRRGVPLAVIRECLQSAAELFGADYPFTSKRFVTDGETVYQEALRAGFNEPELLNLRSRQYAFREIIKGSLYAGIEYSKGFARRWYPEQRSQVIVVDPLLQLGHPVLAQSGIPTVSVYASFLAEGKNKAVISRLFEITPSQVEAAVRFEEKLRKAA